MVGSSCNNSFSKTICSICYEDLKPIVEDLQAISICGHVFHELCLQQWFEYCKNSKKQSCPVCKQGCTQKSVGRLYFQSIGDPICSQSQIDTQKHSKIGDDESPELLRVEVKRLEAKVAGLSSALDLNQKDLKQLNDQLQTCSKQLSKEVLLKNEALRNKECIQAMLQTKSSDLVKSNLECSRLQEKNLALVKEIAALKLVSNCNLEEEDIVKLATIGHESNAQGAIDVLKKSLVICKKSYNELMAKCNSFCREKAHSLRKLEKAKEKIVKLKTRVQELELAIEAKDNEILRSLKASKKRNCNDVIMPSVSKSTEPSYAFKHPTVERKGKSPTSVINLDGEENDDPFVVKETNRDDCTFPCKDELQKLKTVDSHSKADNQKSKSLGFVDCDSNEDWMQQPDHQFGLSCSAGLRNEVLNDHSATKGLLLQDIRQVQPSFNSKADTTAPIPLAEPGDRCFTGGLLGPDGANRYLGKWCKRPQNKSSLGLSRNTDTLISEGADGRGGRVKVLRSLNQASMDARDSITSAKRLKSVTKSSGLQSQGCLQMEHFFQKANK
ncbi:E3 ubiquitin-protein ligase TRAIP-like [Chenopodium quinoa]|uniref:E3 ubiquitin-protein ligase TRAIP-like n=1 Tax=Chenopodium quinoa TaxID=63459 RepID=UPI000B778DE6|nr:E3 ubiquitin-protein ligase TRAIP-like [Chenopodium quinoa]